MPPTVVSRMLGNRVAVSPIVTIEPRRRKFHRPITLTMPLPRAAQKGMLNQYGSSATGDASTLRLLCSIMGKSEVVAETVVAVVRLILAVISRCRVDSDYIFAWASIPPTSHDATFLPFPFPLPIPFSSPSSSPSPPFLLPFPSPPVP